MSQNPTPPQGGKKSKKVLQQEALVSPPWYPDARWHLRTLAVIYAVIITAYYAISSLLSTLPKPYHLRQIPIEMTPWLRPKAERHQPEDKLKAPPETPPAPSGVPKK